MYPLYLGPGDRTLDILRANYKLFMERAYAATDMKYKASCVAEAKKAEAHYKAITGIEMNPGSKET